MQTRSERTREALIRATAELIADGCPADAGLVNICRRAGVSRGALYHHFSSTAALAAAVHEQARGRLEEIVDVAFSGAAVDAPERFCLALTEALGSDKIVRAGMELAPDGSAGPPRLRDHLMSLLRDRVAAAHEAAGRRHGAPPGDLADLAVVVAAGIETLGRSDPGWWDGDTSRRLWGLIRPPFPQADGGHRRLP
ncbi:TetR family transcriptional regulator [Streptomyces sp. CB09001]|uniref:TetR/AcrR family transcriptional regulator n=1 Tax=unclassified Streptomyces TaxID=2593676 RepID=UPI000E2130ED|nr:TetR/AcrR family transcriptional regulator [Streptomyces sp. CB09001]AXL89647.1 TetR family transcriptional regulator [Streptomyces sp. CB09001]